MNDTKIMGHENDEHLKDVLLLGGAIRYVRLFACHVTAMSELLRHINKFLLAYVILFKFVNFRQLFHLLARKKYLIAAMY